MRRTVLSFPLLLLLLAGALLVACDSAPDNDSPQDDQLSAGDTADGTVQPADLSDPSDLSEPPDGATDATMPGDAADVAADTSCVPACAARQCGDDGCGGLCGTCDTGAQCDEAAGVCVAESDCPPGCTEDCPQGCFALGACAQPTATLEAWPSVRTTGLVLSGAQAERADVYYRPEGAATWHRGHDAVRLVDGRLATSLFWLAPERSYEVMLREAGTVLGCATLETLPLEPAHETLRMLYVDAAAAPGGDGSAERPFATISQALAEATPGTDVRVLPGIYRESVAVRVSGTPGRYVRLLGEPGAVLDGSSTQAPSWQPDAASNVWRAPWSGAPTYISRDGARFYHFDSLQGLLDGVGHGGVAMAEGWFFAGGELWVRSASHPAARTWHLPALETGVALDGVSWIWIEGLEVRHFGEGAYPKGIDVRASSDVVVRGNHVHATSSLVWVRRGSSRVRVEGNHLHQSSVFDWPWAAVKGTDHENSAIALEGGTSLLAAGNHIHDIFNGIASGSFDNPQDTSIAFDVDVYANRIQRTGDDGLEPEGAVVNNRFWSNTIDGTHSGISLAPVAVGPVWVLRNRVTDYAQTGLKLSNDSRGPIFVYHNTSYTDGPERNGLGVSGPFENLRSRNNIIRGTRYALEMSLSAGPSDLDWDNLHTPRGAPVIKWQDVRYDSLADLCTATGLECHGHEAAPGLEAPGAGQFALTPTSPNVDAGVHLYGINDGYRGEAPDVGYLELGTSEP